MIPRPKQMRVFKKRFWMTSMIDYQRNAELPEKLFRFLAADLDAYYHKLIGVGFLDDDHSTSVRFTLAPFSRKVPPEYYFLKVDTLDIQIQAESPSGLVHALQTLKQHLYLAYYYVQDEFGEPGDLPCLEIRDWPSYPWRGLHLDVSRHFFDFRFVQRYLDWMARSKLNKFHWHLSDDQGWRLESRKFPRLHKIGAWRKEADGSVHGGWYTRRQVQAVLDHAALRGIEVIPEIDIPGHAMAILAAYPELACVPRDFEVPCVWGISEDILCAGKDEVIDFLKELFSEVAELFPGQYVHLGGDEAPKQRWKDCPHCQARIKNQGLAGEEELQGWLVKTLARHLRGLGKTVIGWDEILDGQPCQDPVVMAWRGDGIDAARKAHDNGNRYILCPYTKLYFDARNNEYETIGTDQIILWGDVLKFRFQDYSFQRKELLLGAQANVWTEHLANKADLKEKVTHRLRPLAEILWNGEPVEDVREFWDRWRDLNFTL